jgi:hypothetical protein
MTKEVVPNPMLERMIGAYMKIRDRRAEIKREYTEEDNELKRKHSLIEAALMKIMQDTGSDNLSVKGLGMAYVTTKTYTKGKDWDALWKYIEESGNLDLLQRRISSKAVQEYMDANEGELPPGVDVSQERAVVVRVA